ncbi:hypothetical protein MUP59_03375 [Candidatus Bathyarchaeota archaeon]|nr:hypothetical protein [Candidatus Bathyarchaeota archaeon]
MSEISLGYESEQETEEEQYRNTLNAVNHKAILEAVSRIHQDDTMSETYLNTVIDAILFIETSSNKEIARSVSSVDSLEDYFRTTNKANYAGNV